MCIAVRHNRCDRTAVGTIGPVDDLFTSALRITAQTSELLAVDTHTIECERTQSRHLSRGNHHQHSGCRQRFPSGFDKPFAVVPYTASAISNEPSRFTAWRLIVSRALRFFELARLLVRFDSTLPGPRLILRPHAVLFSVTRFRWVSVDLA